MTSTSIEWTDRIWNPVTGCSKVSPGCEHCYAETIAHRFAGTKAFPTGFEVSLRPERLAAPLSWRAPARVFVNSMSDLFHDDVPDGFIARVWDVMARSPQHTFQILTKRHGRMRSWVRRWADTTGDDRADEGRASALPPMPRGPEAVRATYTSGRAQLFAAMLEDMGVPPEGAAYPLYDWMEGPRWWPSVLPNVWLGVSVEDQQRAQLRIPPLLDTPAAVRFLSCEPLLGPVDLLGPWDRVKGGVNPTYWLDPKPFFGDPVEVPGTPLTLAPLEQRPAIDWVIAGGESGPKARPMHPAWARRLRDHCAIARVPFFFKQWGRWSIYPTTGPDGRFVERGRVIVADDGTVYQSGDLAYPDGPRHGEALRAGHDRAQLTAMYPLRDQHTRELDGRFHDAFPDAPSSTPRSAPGGADV